MTTIELHNDYHAKIARTDELTDAYIALKDEWQPKLDEASKLVNDAYEEQRQAFDRLKAAEMREAILKEVGAK